MLPTNRISTHPGVLVRETLDELGVSQSAFAEHAGISLQRVNEIINGKRGVTADTAWIFGQAFGTSPEMWMNLQSMHDLTKNRPERTLAPIRAA